MLFLYSFIPHFPLFCAIIVIFYVYILIYKRPNNALLLLLLLLLLLFIITLCFSKKTRENMRTSIYLQGLLYSLSYLLFLVLFISSCGFIQFTIWCHFLSLIQYCSTHLFCAVTLSNIFDFCILLNNSLTILLY